MAHDPLNVVDELGSRDSQHLSAGDAVPRSRREGPNGRRTVRQHDFAGHPAWLASLAVLRYAGVRLIDTTTGAVGGIEPMESGTGDRVTAAVIAQVRARVGR
jgi:hypothetical protein